ncbi:hypothetical protein [Pseudonocardia charpentierae]|uniref:Uncharacterized protein n=1 Tax=Pseudonocardia charpentierae TaxID=3075545 RepID=A0ABU2NLV2_9PSEU|nr:hypothetical protein [Pseudonocardia sp. DSM 45834]MDT0353604.1 hypothetical protein [Pseudonocardia sp. DSM 45834]
MTDNETVVLTVHGGTTPPTLAEAAAQHSVAEQDLNPDFGVRPIDPDRGLYAVEIRADRLPEQEQEVPSPYQGPFSNPRIEAFGPVRGDDEEPPE